MCIRDRLAPLNKDVNKINAEIIEKLPREYKVYKSYDSVKDQPEGGIEFTSEFRRNGWSTTTWTETYKKYNNNALVKLGCTMQRHQFPVRPAFAITIHKAQGQTFEFVGIFLLISVFMRGMLYVAFSRVKRRSSLKFLLPPQNPHHTRNVVWKEILNLSLIHI